MTRQHYSLIALGLLIVGALASWFLLRQPPARRSVAQVPSPTSSATPEPQPSRIIQNSPTTAPTSTPTPTPAPNSFGIVISGTVTERETGFPLPLVNISLVAANATTPTHSTQTVPGGAYTLAGIPDRPSIHLLAERDGYVPKIAEAAPAPVGVTRLDFMLEKAGNVTVHVTDAKGDSVAGAVVHVEEPTLRFSRPDLVTDHEGLVILKNISRGAPPFISAFPPDRDWQSVRAKPRFGDSMNTRLELRLPAGAEDLVVVFYGTVRDPQRRPLPGITVFSGRDSNLIETTSAADGTYRLQARYNFPFGRHLSAYGRGWGLFSYKFSPSKVFPPGPVKIDFTMPKSHSVSGRIVDQSRRGIAGALVEFDVGTHWGTAANGRFVTTTAPSSLRQTTTAADGSFKVEGFPDETVGISASAKGFANASRNVEVDLPVEIQLAPAVFIRGRVIDSNDKRPIPRFSVVLRSMNYAAMGREYPRLEAPVPFHDRAGKFEFNELDNSCLHHLLFSAEGYAPKAVKGLRLDKGPVDDLTVELEPEKRVAFRFLDQTTNQPIPDLMVISGFSSSEREHYWVDLNTLNHELIGAKVSTTGSDGEIAIAEGSVPVTLYASAPGYVDLRITPADRPQYADRPDHWTVPVLKGGSISGIVYFDGVPAPTATIFFQTDGAGLEGDMRTLQTDADGYYEFKGLPPGTYFVTATKMDVPQGIWRLQKRISVKPGEATRANLGSDMGGAALYGLFTVDGKPVPAQHLLLKTDSDWAYREIGVLTNADGTYKVSGLTNGAYQIMIVGPDRSSFRSLPAGTTVQVNGLTAYDIQLRPR